MEIGSVVGGLYKVLSVIGSGGMSVVYMAINEKANKTWAIKEVRRDGKLDFEVIKQGLIVETDMLKKLRHPNLPSIIDVIEESESFLIVMDYIEGNPLSRAVEESALPQDLVIEWAKQLCDVLGYLHSQSPPIIYRDMKPDNVMLKPDGTVTLIDFGTAREFKDSSAISDTVSLGTVGYAAPEQFGEQGQTDARTDIYCLGATLYHLVTGQRPDAAPYVIRPIREINPGLSEGFERIILKCMQRNPADRYQNCAELMYALEHYEQFDSYYRSKQKRKMGIFLLSLVLTVGCFSSFIWGYSKARAKKTENYQNMVMVAMDASLSRQVQIERYLDAIRIDPTQTAAYLQMLDLFLLNEEEALTKTEASVLIQLQVGLDVKENGTYIRTLYPLEELKAKNRDGYSTVCYEIGMAYWYKYDIESARYTVAMDWFREASVNYPIAQIYWDIGQCHQQINKFAGQNRTEKMYETYGELWLKLRELKSIADGLDDNDTKMLVWIEVVRTVSDKAQYFLTHTQKEEIFQLLDDILLQSDELLQSSWIDIIKDNLLDLRMEILEAEKRIDSIKERGALDGT